MVPSSNSSLLVALQNKFLQLMSKVKHSVHADPFFDPILDRFFLSQLGAHFSCSLYERESTVIFEIRHRTVCNLHIWQSNCSLIIPQRFTQPRLIPIKRHCADLNQLYRVQIRDGSGCEARRYSLTLQVPGSLLSKKACLIYRERSKPSYAQEPRSGSYSGAQHRTHGFILFCFLSGFTERLRAAMAGKLLMKMMGWGLTRCTWGLTAAGCRTRKWNKASRICLATLVLVCLDLNDPHKSNTHLSKSTSTLQAGGTTVHKSAHSNANLDSAGLQLHAHSHRCYQFQTYFRNLLLFA